MHDSSNVSYISYKVPFYKYMHSVSAIFLQEHPIHGCIHDASNNLKPFPILAIDNIPLNLWINENTNILSEQIIWFPLKDGFTNLMMSLH